MLDGEERKFLFKQITPSPNQFFPTVTENNFLVWNYSFFFKTIRKFKWFLSMIQMIQMSIFNLYPTIVIIKTWKNLLNATKI